MAIEMLELDYISCNRAPAVVPPLPMLYGLLNLRLSRSATVMYNRIAGTL